MVTFPEATSRLFKNVFVCRKCKTVVRAPIMKVLAKKVKCRRCGSRELRPKRKK